MRLVPRAAALFAPVAAVALVLGACGGDDDNGGVLDGGAPGNDLVAAMIKSPISSLPDFTTSPSSKRESVGSTEKTAGVTGHLTVTFKSDDKQAELAFFVFDSADHAEAYSRLFSSTLPAGGARAFLPYLPAADCADVGSVGLCGLVVANVFARATASQVAGGAAALIASANTYLANITGLAAEKQTAVPTKGSGPDPCVLLPKADAEAVLGPVGNPRNLGNGCQYNSVALPGDSVALALQDGGKDQFDFTQSHTANTKPLSGVGDKAFTFVSAAGFVQIYILKGSNFVAITVSNSKEPGSLDKPVALAKKVVARLK